MCNLEAEDNICFEFKRLLRPPLSFRNDWQHPLVVVFGKTPSNILKVKFLIILPRNLEFFINTDSWAILSEDFDAKNGPRDNNTDFTRAPQS